MTLLGTADEPKVLAEVLFATKVAATSDTIKLFFRKSGTEFTLISYDAHC